MVKFKSGKRMALLPEMEEESPDFAGKGAG